MPQAESAFHEMDILSNTAMFAVISRPMYPYSLKKSWWLDDQLRLKRMNMGVGLFFKVGARPEWVRLRFFRGTAPKRERAVSVLSADDPLVCPAEFVGRRDIIFSPSKRDPVKLVPLKAGLTRYTVVANKASIDLYFEKVAKDSPSRIRNTLDQTATLAQPDVPGPLSEAQEIDRMLARFVFGLRRACIGRSQIDENLAVDAIQAYLTTGGELGCSPLELRDYFDISTPSLPEQAGYSKTLERKVAALYESASASMG
ncbi:MAG: hypothetical protein AAGN82_29495 [Myxococcota bacterium]